MRFGFEDVFIRFPLLLAPKSISASDQPPSGLRVDFSPPNATLGIVRYKALTEGSSCKVSANAAEYSCFLTGLQAAKRYDISGFACDENDVCSEPRNISILIPPQSTFQS